MTQTKNKKQNFDKKGKKKKEFLNESNTKQKKKRKEKKNIPQIFELIEVYGCLINRFFFTFFFFFCRSNLSPKQFYAYKKILIYIDGILQ